VADRVGTPGLLSQRVVQTVLEQELRDRSFCGTVDVGDEPREGDFVPTTTPYCAIRERNLRPLLRGSQPTRPRFAQVTDRRSPSRLHTDAISPRVLSILVSPGTST